MKVKEWTIISYISQKKNDDNIKTEADEFVCFWKHSRFYGLSHALCGFTMTDVVALTTTAPEDNQEALQLMEGIGGTVPVSTKTML